MTDKFDLARRAEELFAFDRDRNNHRDAAIQLCSELAEAIAAECEARAIDKSSSCGHCDGLRHGATIARSFARQRSREAVYREALEQLRHGRYASDETEGGYCSRVTRIAQRALDEGAKREAVTAAPDYAGLVEALERIVTEGGSVSNNIARDALRKWREAKP